VIANRSVPIAKPRSRVRPSRFDGHGPAAEPRSRRRRAYRAAGWAAALHVALYACGDDTGSTIPRFVDINYVDLSAIARISKFRSAVGHDYADDFETCRSMKHYFEPRADVDWSDVAIVSPVDGTIAETREEWAGTQIAIASHLHPEITFVVFHVQPADGIAAGARVTAGQPLGTHVGPQTMSDIAVRIETAGGTRLVSYFEVMSDALFEAYRARGIRSRADLILSRAERDVDPLRCRGQEFVAPSGAADDWVPLNPRGP